MDIAIIGAGPGGLSAALYGARYGLLISVYEGMAAGGQMIKTSAIENYPGIPGVTDGYTLAENMRSQAKENGVVFINEEVKNIDFENKIIYTNKSEKSYKTIILAMGAKPRKLEVPGEEEFLGRGVSYCATCDGMFFKNKTAAVIGGGDTALEDALFLKNICKKVYIIHRRDELRAINALKEKAEAAENIEIVYSAKVEEISGDDAVSEIKTSKGIIKTDGVFIAVGNVPQSKLCEGKIKLHGGYVVTDEDMRTNVPGVFCCGDLRDKTLRQIVTACSDGACAAYSAALFIEEK